MGSIPPGLGVIHSSILVWSIPWTEEPGRLQTIDLQRVRHDWSDLALMHARKTKSWACLYERESSFCWWAKMSMLLVLLKKYSLWTWTAKQSQEKVSHQGLRPYLLNAREWLFFLSSFPPSFFFFLSPSFFLLFFSGRKYFNKVWHNVTIIGKKLMHKYV